MQYLRADTNTEVLIGPAVAVGDGFTPVTTLSLSTADEAEIIKYGGATPLTVTSISANGFSAITGADGYYTLDITTGNSDTEGFLTVLINDDSLILPIRVDFMVVNANVYDSLFAAATTDYLQTDAIQISGDATAADNLELQYDGTGLTGDTYPASQAQVGAIGSATGGGLSFEAVADNVLGAIKTVAFVGVQTGGTYANTEAEDNIYHNITHSGNAIDIVYQFDVGGGRTCSEVTFKGYLSSANDTITVQMYDFVGSDWETRGFIVGQGGTSNITNTYKALSKHTGASGADLGSVLIRFVCTAQTSPDFFVDELITTGVSEGQSVGYANGAIWIDTVTGTAGTELFVNGVADNPVDSIADANTLDATLNLDRFELSPDSSVTFTATQASQIFNGKGYTLALGGQDLTGTHIVGATVSGTATTAGAEIHFTDCEIGTCSVGASHFANCGLTSTITFTEATTYTFQTCHSEIAGSGSPVIDFGAAVGNTSLNMRRYSGGVEIQNMGATGTDTMSLEGHGALTINANCTGGTIVLRGLFTVTDNSGGAVTVTYDDGVQTVLSILEDTNELQTDWANGGRLDLILDELTTQGDTNAAAIAALNDLAASDVLTQVNAALDTAIAELGVGAPTATPTIRTGLMLLYMMARNRVDVDTTGTDALKIYNDAGTQIASKTITDDGTDYSESEMA